MGSCSLRGRNGSTTSSFWNRLSTPQNNNPEHRDNTKVIRTGTNCYITHWNWKPPLTESARAWHTQRDPTILLSFRERAMAASNQVPPWRQGRIENNSNKFHLKMSFDPFQEEFGLTLYWEVPCSTLFLHLQHRHPFKDRTMASVMFLHSCHWTCPSDNNTVANSGAVMEGKGAAQETAAVISNTVYIPK